MDKNKIRNYQIFSTLFIFVLGTLLQFTYKLSGENNLVGIFSTINESTWEHLKLVYFPSLITIIIGLIYLRGEYKNFLCSKTIGMLVAMVFIVVFFYTYSGILGRTIQAIDISSFFIAVIIGEFVAYLLIINKFKCNNIIFIIILLALLICFILFTFNTPHFGIFKDPLTGQYGIIK